MMQPITTMEQEILWIQAVNNIKVSKYNNFAKCVWCISFVRTFTKKMKRTVLLDGIWVGPAALHVLMFNRVWILILLPDFLPALSSEGRARTVGWKSRQTVAAESCWRRLSLWSIKYVSLFFRPQVICLDWCSSLWVSRVLLKNHLHPDHSQCLCLFYRVQHTCLSL